MKTSAPLTQQQLAVLRFLRAQQLSNAATIAREFGHSVSAELEALTRMRLLTTVPQRTADGKRTSFYGLTVRGGARLKTEERAAIHCAPAARRASVTHTEGTYAGAELRPFVGRPGSMDAFALPSRMSNRLVYRDGREERLP